MRLGHPAPESGGASRRSARPRRLVAAGALIAGVVFTVTLDLLATPRQGRVSGASEVAQSCTVVWSEPETLRTAKNGGAVMVDVPEAAEIRSGVLIVGRLALETNARGVIIPAAGAPHDYIHSGVLVRDDGLAVLLPVPLDSPPSYTRVAAISDSAAVMLWSHREFDEMRSTGIWSAEFDGTAWQNVQRVVRGVDLQWHNTTQSALLVRNGELRIGVGPSGLKRDSGILLFRRRGGEWSTTPLRTPSSSYVQLADLPGDTLLVASVLAAHPDGNTVFTQRFDLAGNAIGERQRVSAPGIGIVYDPRIRVAHDSVVYLYWIAWSSDLPPAAGDSGNQRLQLARSWDKGVSWDHVQGPRIDMRRASWVGGMVDGRGRLHVTTVWHPDSLAHPLHVMWDGRAWHASAPPRVLDGLAGNAPVLIERSADSLQLFWSSLRASDPGSVPGVLLSSTGLVACDPGVSTPS